MLAAAVLSVSAADSRLSAQDVDPCNLISKAEAAEILAKPEILKAKSMPAQDGTCGYLGAPFDVHTEILKSPSGWSASAKKLIQDKKAEPVEKIGDEAVFTTDGNGDFVMTSRKANRIVTVTMFSDKTTRAEAKPKLVKLLTLAVSKIR
jgi:hypothetical protein